MESACTCPVCGSQVSAQETWCPICGTELVGVTASRMPAHVAVDPPNSAASDSSGAIASKVKGMTRKHARHQSSRRPVGRRVPRAALIAVATTVVVVIIVIVAVALSNDIRLKEQAKNPDEASPAETASTGVSGKLGTASGNLSGGGVAVASEDKLFECSSTGVFVRDKGSFSADGATMITDDQAVYLNLVNGDLCYIALSSNDRDTATEGVSVRMVESTPKDRGATQSSRVLYRAEEGAKVSWLNACDGKLFFLRRDANGFGLMRLPLDGASGAEEIDHVNCDEAQLLLEGSFLTLVISGHDGWKVERASLDDALTLSEVASGKGRLLASCMHEGAFYYSLDSGSEGSSLFRSDLQGNVKEYSEVVGAVRLAAAGDRLYAQTAQGQLVWLDRETGFAHDVTGIVGKDVLSNMVPEDVQLAAFDSQVCMRGSNGVYVRVDVESSKSINSV